MVGEPASWFRRRSDRPSSTPELAASSCGYGDVAFKQAAISGLFAAVRGRHVAERSVGKAAAFLVAPQ